MPNKHILFLLSGSVACFKACEVISALVAQGHEVQTAVTPQALQFIGEATLQGLTHRPVYKDMFAPRQSGTEHISLTTWADVTVLCPATANILGKMAAGIGDDCVSTLFLAHSFSKPFLVAPAMNTAMYQHPATQSAMAKLQKWGVQFIACGTGRLACGVQGEGRLAEPTTILEKINVYL